MHFYMLRHVDFSCDILEWRLYIAFLLPERILLELEEHAYLPKVHIKGSGKISFRNVCTWGSLLGQQARDSKCHRGMG